MESHINSIFVPCQTTSAVRVIPLDAGSDRGEQRGTTAEMMCQSPKRDSWVTTVLVDEVMSDGDEDSMPCFLQPKRAESIDIQRTKILKFLQIEGWVIRITPFLLQAFGLSLRCRWYMILRHS